FDGSASDFHRHPPRQSARRQTSGNRGTDHRHSLYSRREATATFAGSAKVNKDLTVGRRGY
ncbi:hypothetical protein NEUTE1DRAFT_72229, partial [Neurospora tetrasperma FGSC 2508]